jgi:putative membrane protein
MIELILALILGVSFGIITGLFPGIHINLVAAGLLALVSGSLLAGLPVMALVVFVVAMAVTHTFIDFIPSIYLGAPEEDSFLSVLPGHTLLREGRGHEAVVLTLYGSLVGLVIVIIFSFIFVWLLEDVFSLLEGLIPYILIFASFYLIFREEDFLVSIVVFVLAGFLGLLSFNLPVREPLLPLLSGMFGLSGLIVSLKDRISISGQKLKRLGEIRLTRREFIRGVMGAGISAPLASFLPGIGSGHAAVIGSELVGSEDKRSFLFLVGAINTIVMALSFVTIYAIGRSRTGAAVAVSELLGEIALSNLVLIVGVVLVSGILAFIVGVGLSRIIALRISQINYFKLSIGIIILLVMVNIVLSNVLGLLVLVVGSALGVFAILSGARRINLMGALLVPTILFYLI